MIGTILGHILRFVVLILLQVLVLDHLDVLNGYLVPYLYVLFLLMLPIELPAWAQLAIGAFTGLVMDLFLVHHLWLFFIEIHRFDAFFGTFLRALLSALFTFGLCLLAQFLTSGPERDRR